MDDNSPDQETKDIINSYDDERIIKVFGNISEENRFKTARYATLINEAFPLSSGDYITYLVDDDLYYPERLELLVDYVIENPSHEVVYHPLENVDASGRGAGVRGIKGILDGKTEETQAFNYVDHNMVMHSRQAFINAKGWYDDPGVWGGADAYFWQRLNESGYLFYPVGDNEKPLAGKRYHETNLQARLVRGEFFPK
jgi:spore maturation protein CgeD